MSQGGYGAYNAYISATTVALGAPTLYDHPSSIYGSKHGNTDVELKLLVIYIYIAAY